MHCCAMHACGGHGLIGGTAVAATGLQLLPMVSSCMGQACHVAAVLGGGCGAWHRGLSGPLRAGPAAGPASVEGLNALHAWACLVR